MSRAAIKYQSYFISLRTNRVRTFHFWRINFFSLPRAPPLLLSLVSSVSLVLSIPPLSRFVLLSSRFSQSTYGFAGQWCPAAIKYQSYLISRGPTRYGMLRAAAWCPGVFRLANMKSAAAR